MASWGAARLRHGVGLPLHRQEHDAFGAACCAFHSLMASAAACRSSAQIGRRGDQHAEGLRPERHRLPPIQTDPNLFLAQAGRRQTPPTPPPRPRTGDHRPHEPPLTAPTGHSPPASCSAILWPFTLPRLGAVQNARETASSRPWTRAHGDAERSIWEIVSSPRGSGSRPWSPSSDAQGAQGGAETERGGGRARGAAPPRIIRTNAPEPPYAGDDGFAYYVEPRLATEVPVEGFPVLIVSGRRVL